MDESRSNEEPRSRLRERMEGIREVFERERGVSLAYVSGSAAREGTTPLSDLDFAVYLNEDIPEDSYSVSWS